MTSSGREKQEYRRYMPTWTVNVNGEIFVGRYFNAGAAVMAALRKFQQGQIRTQPDGTIVRLQRAEPHARQHCIGIEYAANGTKLHLIKLTEVDAARAKTLTASLDHERLFDEFVIHVKREERETRSEGLVEHREQAVLLTKFREIDFDDD